jgi:ubiquinone/menaquinone biosynthesis C-methylase UbiE
MKFEKLLQNTGDMALKRRALNVINELELKNGDRVLDVGCGDGYYLHLLSNLGMDLKLTGTDFDEAGLKKAKSNLNGKIPLYKADLMKKLPFKTNSFDKIVMSEVIEHLPDDTKGLKEVYRVLKVDGTLCLTVPNHNYPLLWDPINWLLEHFFGFYIKSGFFAGIWNQHERLYTPKQIKRVVEKTGFKANIVKSLTWWCLPFNHYIVNLVARFLAHSDLSSEKNKALSKYTKNPKRPILLNAAFVFVNLLDRLNDIWQPSGRGVSIFVRATKPQN